MSDLSTSFTIRLRGATDASVGALRGEFSRLGRVARSEIDSIKKSFSFAKSAFALGRDISQSVEGVQHFKDKLDTALEGPLKKFEDFDLAMSRVKGVLQDTSSFDRIKSKALEMGKTTRFSAQEAAEAFQNLATQGLTTAQQIAELPVVLKVASAGQLSLAESVHLTQATLHQFGLGVKDAGSVMDVMQTAATNSATDLHEMGETLKYLGPVAHAAGIGIQGAAKMAALLASSGLEGSMAGTSAVQVMQALAGGAGKAQKVLHKLGVSKKEAIAALADPVKLMALLDERMEAKHLKTTQRAALMTQAFGRGAKGALVLMEKATQKGDDGLTLLQRLDGKFANASGALDRAASAVDNSASGKLAKVRNQIDTLNISIGEKLMPTELKLKQRTSELVGKLADWADKNPELLDTSAKLAVGLGPVLGGITATGFAINTTVTAVGLLGSGLRIAATPVTALTKYVWDLNKSLRAKDLANATSQLELFGGTAPKVSKLGTALQFAGKAFAVLGAASAGYEFGKLLDEWIGKVANLRGGLVSTELALRAGESTGTSTTINDVKGAAAAEKAGKGYQTAAQAERLKRWFPDIAGNLQTENDRAAAGGVASHRGIVEGEIQIKVTDDRVKVQSSTRGPVRLPVGATP